MPAGFPFGTISTSLFVSKGTLSAKCPGLASLSAQYSLADRNKSAGASARIWLASALEGPALICTRAPVFFSNASASSATASLVLAAAEMRITGGSGFRDEGDSHPANVAKMPNEAYDQTLIGRNRNMGPL